MTTTQVKTILVPLVGLVAVLATGFGGQVLIGAEGRYNSVYFDPRFPLVVMPLTSMLTALLTVGALLWLFWWVMTQAPRCRLVAVIYLVVGLVGLNYTYLYFGTGYMGLPFSLPLPSWASSILGFDSQFSHSAAGAAMAGLLMLVLPRHALTPALPPKGEGGFSLPPPGCCARVGDEGSPPAPERLP